MVSIRDFIVCGRKPLNMYYILTRPTEHFTRILHDASSSYASGFYCVTKNADTRTMHHMHKNHKRAADKKISFLQKIITGDKNLYALQSK
jgi:hypothetical protein